jgi:hypothetical protein
MEIIASCFATALELGLDHAPTRLLLYMAGRSYSTPSGRMCHCGQEALWHALGYDPRTPREEAAASRSVGRALFKLRQAGIVATRYPSSPGTPATYLIKIPARLAGNAK